MLYIGQTGSGLRLRASHRAQADRQGGWDGGAGPYADAGVGLEKAREAAGTTGGGRARRPANGDRGRAHAAARGIVYGGSGLGVTNLLYYTSLLVGVHSHVFYLSREAT